MYAFHFLLGPGSKVVMHGTANPVFGSSILPPASSFKFYVLQVLAGE